MNEHVLYSHAGSTSYLVLVILWREKSQACIFVSFVDGHDSWIVQLYENLMQRSMLESIIHNPPILSISMSCGSTLVFHQ
jgi:hypothetical protein